jgi:hypothetical protein
MLIITHNTVCLGNFLHPKYKGSMLNVGGDNTTFETTKGNLVNNHQSHIDYLASQELISTPQAASNLHDAFNESEFDLLDQMTQITQTQPSRPSVRKSPIQLEVEKYLDLTPRAATVDVDILKWWRVSLGVYTNIYDMTSYILIIL